jgi:hypothetical protein
MSGKGKGCGDNVLINGEVIDEGANAAVVFVLTLENLWDGRVVVDHLAVDHFNEDMMRVLHESELLIRKIGKLLDEEFTPDSRQLTHEAALRIADVLTPQHEEVSRVQEIFERRVNNCPLCMINIDVVSVHLASPQHLLRVQQHHELRGWVKKVVPTLQSTCYCPRYSSCTCLVPVLHCDHGPHFASRTRCMSTSQSIAGIRLKWPEMNFRENDDEATLSGNNSFSCASCSNIDGRMPVMMSSTTMRRTEIGCAS